MSDFPERDIRDFGPQPLDTLLQERGWNNHRLVEVSLDHLTHKMVARARKGRKLTKNAQTKVLDAVNLILKAEGAEEGLSLRDLFNYNRPKR